MRRSRLVDNKIFWCVAVLLLEFGGCWAAGPIINLAGLEAIGKVLSSATVLLSVAVAVVVHLWGKLNDLSALPSFTSRERRELWSIVRDRVRSLVWLVIFLVAFIFFVLATAAIATANEPLAVYLLHGVAAGFGAAIALIAAVLVDLNEVAAFRWKVETSDHVARRATRTISELKKSEEGFEEDEGIQGYNRVVNGDEPK